MILLWLTAGILSSESDVVEHPQSQSGFVSGKGTYRRYNLIEIQEKLETVFQSTIRPKSRRDRKRMKQSSGKSISELLLSIDVTSPETPIAMREFPSILSVEQDIDATEWRTMVRALALQSLMEIRARLEIEEENEIEELLLMAA